MGRRDPAALSLPQPRLILDTGALIALERGNARARAHVAAAVRRGYVLAVPVLCLLEVMAGARHPAAIERVLAAIDLELPLLPAVARQVAGIRRRAGLGSDADAVVVLEALAVPGSAVLTGDAGDILALLEAAEGEARVPAFRV